MSTNASGPHYCLSVGKVHSAPGKAPARGPCAIHITHDHISTIEALDQAPFPTPHHIALPALANAHDHGRGMRSLAFGAADQALETWLTELVQEPRIDPYLRAAVAFARMVEGGICASNHCHNTQDGRQLLAEARGVAQAARDVGIRVAFALPFAGHNSLVYDDFPRLLSHLPQCDHARALSLRQPTRSLAENLALVEQIAQFEHPGFRVQYGPVGPQWVDTKSMEAIAEASERTGRGIHMHLFETRLQREWADRHFTGGLIRHFDQIGLLSPRLTLAHAVWLNVEECELLAARGVQISANLSSNLRLQSGFPPWKHYLDGKLKFGIGLDGMSCDDDEDMLRELRLAWRHIKTGAPEIPFTLGDLFEAACVHGRYSITGNDGGGVLTENAPADILVIDSRRLMADVLDHACADDLSLILARANKHDIAQLFIAGRQVVEDRHCISVNLAELEARLMEEARQALRDNPPDLPAMVRLHDAVAKTYRCMHLHHE